ncbi:MAG: SsrA-binding protein SmpB [Myxococcota bacterium]
MATKPKTVRNISENRRARHEYEILESLEVGMSLTGSEVKSLRGGKATIADAYIRFQDDEAFLVDAHIPQYPQAGPHNNHPPTRPRKLLMHRKELEKWSRKVAEKGLTAIPLKLYFQGAWVKLEVGLGRGRKLHDKRAALKEREHQRDTERALRRR